MNIVQKIVSSHLDSNVESMKKGESVALKIDHTLTHDALGTLVFLQFEAIGLPRVQVERAVSYADHNVYQFSHHNTEDHRFIRAASRKYGATYFRPGAGICHQIHVERFAAPGKTLLGSDSHTPTSGGLGMLAIGAGGMDIAVAMGGGPYNVSMPKVVEIYLTGSLQPWVTAKDVILELLRKYTVTGGVGKIFEYTGPGVASLSIPERCTICNMGTELGLTTSVFPSDGITKDFLIRADRESDWIPLQADDSATYDERIELNLSEIVPLIAQPGMPDRVVPVTEITGLPVDQVIVGSCTNGSYSDILQVAQILDGNKVHRDVEMVVAPSSKQGIELLTREGWTTKLLKSGVNLSEATCGACMGSGHVPAENSVSLRTFNRNFSGRSGLQNDQIYLCSPILAAVSAIEGKIVDPREWGKNRVAPSMSIPNRFDGSDADLIPPADEQESKTIQLPRTENMPPIPPLHPLPQSYDGTVAIKVKDDITTDDISPLGADIMGFWANIPKLAESTFRSMDPDFVQRTQQLGGGIIVGKLNYGQGSSREQAAVAPRYLGIRVVLAVTIARIHRANLINWGIVPLLFESQDDYENINQGDQLSFDRIADCLQLEGGNSFIIKNISNNIEIKVVHNLNPRERDVILAGGLLPYTRHSISSKEA
jgi:aconitate hydratase